MIFQATPLLGHLLSLVRFYPPKSKADLIISSELLLIRGVPIPLLEKNKENYLTHFYINFSMNLPGCNLRKYLTLLWEK